MSAQVDLAAQELLSVASADADELLSDESLSEHARIERAFLHGVTHGAHMVGAGTMSFFALEKAKK